MQTAHYVSCAVSTLSGRSVNMQEDLCTNLLKNEITNTLIWCRLFVPTPPSSREKKIQNKKKDVQYFSYSECHGVKSVEKCTVHNRSMTRTIRFNIQPGQDHSGRFVLEFCDSRTLEHNVPVAISTHMNHWIRWRVGTDALSRWRQQYKGTSFKYRCVNIDGRFGYRFSTFLAVWNTPATRFIDGHFF